MAALTQDRDTKVKGEFYLQSYKLAAVQAFAGGMVAVTNATGFAAAAADAAGVTVVGVAKEGQDNSGGAAGDKEILCGAGVYKFANVGGGGALVQADVGQNCFVVDDQTVGKTGAGGGVNGIVAGKLLRLDSDGAWVKVGL